MSHASTEACYHCGLDIPAGANFEATLDDQPQYFCCPGCLAVAETIHQSGLSNFYSFRSQSNQRPDLETLRENYKTYDLPQLQQEFVVDLAANESGSNDLKYAQFLIEGITCAACVWLIEHHLSAIDGINLARVNASSGRLTLQWHSDVLALSAVMAAVAAIGYRLTPATEDSAQKLADKERKLALMRLGVAGFGMMQVGMVAVVIYAGASGHWLSYWRWISLIIAAPVVFFSARPFFEAAWRAFRNRHLVMDVPVALAIAFAFSASVWATLSQSGEVYFDSVSMFTFFLLLGRYLEMSTRHSNRLGMTRLAQLLPLTATKVEVVKESTEELRSVVPLRSLAKGDHVSVASGEVIPCDGLVLEGQSKVVESMLTGESDAVAKQPGDQVVAGTNNIDSPLLVEVEAVGKDTTLSAIERLVDHALANKPTQIALADRLASWFVAAVLLIASVTAWFWWQHDPSHVLWVVLSVLVVTCPCALSLATPTAHAAALARLRKAGLLVLNSNAFSALAKINHIVFDKTGTLTLGEPQVQKVSVLDNSSAGLSETQVLEIIAALEQDSSHPIARAFLPWSGKRIARHKQATTSGGVAGVIDDTAYYFGRSDYVTGCVPSSFDTGTTDIKEPEGAGWLLLACDDYPIAWIQLTDGLRDSAKESVTLAKQLGIEVSLLSGDHQASVDKVAGELGINQALGRVLPADKLAHVQQYQANGGVVLMVGDGINDIPVLSAADVSVAMASATDLAQTKSDAVLLNGDLTLLLRLITFTKQLQRTIKQNLAWALGYNGLALPLAVAGLVPPWAAAIGMSVSSLIVVANALRLSSYQV